MVRGSVMSMMTGCLCCIDDARLWDALKRAYLVDQVKQGAEGEDESQNRFSLDTPIEDEGGNLSVGQVGSLG
jgi:ABC-type multidrug transport system fused ATPase/permease subunit